MKKRIHPDTKRINWLEKRSALVNVCAYGRCHVFDPILRTGETTDLYSEAAHSYGDTYREAIDRAISF